MKKSISLIILLFVQPMYLNADGVDWLDVLHKELSHRFNSEIRKTQVEYKDHLENKIFNATRLDGEGSLHAVADPFKTMTDLFVESGWLEDWRYLADKHGGTSTAYREGPYFCIASVDIDARDSEPVGNTPSRYWYSLVCREANPPAR